MKPGRELDALVGTKAMGYVFADGNWFNTTRPMPYDTDPVHLPEFSTDIKDAWIVVDSFSTPDPQSEIFDQPYAPIRINAVIRTFDGKWIARFDDPISGNEMPGYYERSCYPNSPPVQFAIGDSPAHAICLAALRAKGIDVSQSVRSEN